MFESSQQEDSSGTVKIVGGVIAIVAVLLVVVYFLFLHGQPPAATATGAGTGAKAAATSEKPDPMRDLSIMKSNLRRDQTQTMAMWDIVVANRSRAVSYTGIRYATNYYNSQDAVIYHNEGTLPDPVEPGDQHTFTSVNDGLYPVGTARYTIELKGAEPAQ